MNANMALLLLKMNNLEGASILLSKANSYNSERLNEAVANVQSELSLSDGIEKNEKHMAEKYDNKNLIHRESLADIQQQAKKESVEIDEPENDDSGSFEAKYFYYFISGLFEYVFIVIYLARTSNYFYLNFNYIKNIYHDIF